MFCLGLLANGDSSLAASPSSSRLLDNFDDLRHWQVQHSDDVSASISSFDGQSGKALRMDFDFTDAKGNPINGYATAHRALPLDLPGNFELSFRVRGDAPVNNLQFKLIDASGDNVWWVNKPDFDLPHEWQQIRIKKRQIEFAWGPASDRALKHIASIEFVVSSGRDGGKGSVYFDQLTLRDVADETNPPAPRLSASSALQEFPASAAMDGDAKTAWRSDPAQGAKQHLDFDFGVPREFGGLVAHWRKGERATNWAVQQSDDARHWHSCAGVSARSGDDDFLMLCELEARYVRLSLSAGEAAGYGLDEVEFKDPAWAATRNAFYQNVAGSTPRGTYPRSFSEQSYWTIVGVDGGAAPALISEDGAIEPRKGGYSIEPFLRVDGRTLSWADVKSTQTLVDGYLPMPGVTWSTEKVALNIDAFARGTRDCAQLVARYRVQNTTGAPIEATLRLAIRPFQVNPPAQFLNSPGGVSSIQALRWKGTTLEVDGVPMWTLTKPNGYEAVYVDGSPLPATSAMYDAFGEASGALLYALHLPARGEQEVDIVAPISGVSAPPDLSGLNPTDWVQREHDAVAAAWRDKLNRVKLTLPAGAQRIADAVRTAHAQILMSRDGAALRPGTRSYARSWIRDGAMIADGLLRLGDIDDVRDYVDWYAPHQFASGKVPCCVDHRGSDPVPENDSHGELIHSIAQLYRYGGDRAGLEKQWPHVESAVAYMDTLRASQTGAANPAFKGLMPASISHEGYSAKPMHSYWDDFWALTGYKDAAFIAQTLGKADASRRMAQSRDEFRRDLFSSIALAVQAHGIEFLPGCAELGDFDATSSTVALSPAGEQSPLADILRRTFERYWNEFSARADGTRSWNDYTPYEWRAVGSFVRLGWRERAQAAIVFFFDTGARPGGWNQWAEVVGHDPRQIRFIGDMPHGWVASDFIRSALDLFAYEREPDGALVLAGGVPAAWLTQDGIAIDGLRTPYGRVAYTLKTDGKALALRIGAEAKPPGGFVFAWPLGGSPGETRINGMRASWHDGMLRIASAPADVVIELTEKSAGDVHAH